MALGMTGFEDFKPKASKTAKELLSATTSHEQVKKDKQIQLRIDYDMFLTFQEICREGKTDMSTVIRKYITNIVKRGFI